MKFKLLLLLVFTLTCFIGKAQCVYMDVIEKYAPKIYMHPKDIHRPMDVETFIEGATLYDDNEQVILSNVTLDDLTNPLYNQSNYSLGNYTYQGNYYGPGNVLSDRTGDSLTVDNKITSNCYAKMIHTEHYTDIVYSFFYQWNGFQVFHAEILDGFSITERYFEWRDFARHEGDWEHVTVRVSPDFEEIIGIFGSAHGNSTFYSAESSVLTYHGTHPIFYAALNSHATYPEPGARSTTTISSIPVFSIWSLEDADVTGNVSVNTYESGPFPDSIIWETWNHILWIDSEADSIDAYKWLNFAGDFGVAMPESQVEQTPSLPANAESDLYVAATIGDFVGALDDYIHKSGASSPLQQTNFWNTEEGPMGNQLLIHRTESLGSGEEVFDDSPQLVFGSVLNEVNIRTGTRVDQVEFIINDTTALTHGGGGGTLGAMTLAPNDKVNRVELYSDMESGALRIFWIKFTTELGNTLEGGTAQGQYLDIPIPADKNLMGMYGRAGSEVDNLGFLLIDTAAIEPCLDVTSIKELLGNEDQLKVYPNPTSGMLTVDSDSYDINLIQLYNSSGKCIVSSEENVLSLEELPSGFYYLQVRTSRGRLSRKIIVQ